MTGSPYLAGGSSYRQWLDALADITRAVNNDQSEREVGDLIAKTCTRLVGVDRAIVMVAEQDRNALRAVGASGLSSDFMNQVNDGETIKIYPEGHELAGSPSSRVFRERRSISIPDVQNSTEFAPWLQFAEAEGYRAMFAVPLLTGNEALGTIACYNDTVGQLNGPQRELARPYRRPRCVSAAIVPAAKSSGPEHYRPESHPGHAQQTAGASTRP
ncbi:GAF domain-containing protein [Aeromicrobium sp. UC242_57]|uniref:GAF domain-containing protein n=1 Tax=Aeromicrobium sp. UC242_57 TaxID=3374624 RepID=UPI00379C817A